MRKVGLAIGAVMMMAAQASAASTRAERFQHSLEMLAPSERLQQICDYTAMQKIGHAGGYRPDRAVGDARASTVVVKDTIVAEGAAFRSHGKWYELTFTCTATADHLKVLSFQYRIGSEIPENKWAAYHLW